MAQPSVQGRLIWQELVIDDPAAVTPFYEKVLSWRAQPSATDPAYTNFSAARSGPIAGATKPTAAAGARGTGPHWLLYIGVADVDAALATAVRLGAKVLHGAADIDVGRYAVLSDPQGATFAIYKPHEAKPAPGEFSWLELATPDFDAALKFYQEVYGWQLIERMDMGPRGFYLIFGNDGVQRGGIYKLPASAPHPYWISYTEVADVEKTIAVTTKAGGKLLTGPHTVPGGGRIAQLIDPAGALFAVHTQPKVPATAPAPASPAASEAPKPPAPKKSSPAPKPAATAPAAKAPAPAAPVAPVAKKPAPVTPPPAAPTPAPAPAKSAAKKKPAKKVAKKAPAPAVKKAAKKVAKKAAKKTPAKKKKVAVRLSAPARKTVKPAARKAPKEDKKKKEKKKDKKKRKKDKARRKK